MEIRNNNLKYQSKVSVSYNAFKYPAELCKRDETMELIDIVCKVVKI